MKLRSLLIALVLFPVSELASAQCQYTFNWSCAGCARILGRTTGQVGPFPDESSCNSARSAMQSNMRSVGGGVTINSCTPNSYVACSAGPTTGGVPGGGRVSPGPSGPSYPEQGPTIDYEAERRAEEERQRADREAADARRRREQETQARFERNRADLLQQLKGGAPAPAVGAPALELKGGTAAAALELKGAASPALASGAEAQVFACAGWIAGYAFPAAKSGDRNEVRYLAQQVDKTLRGEAPGVACPKDLKAPPVGNVGPVGPGTDIHRFYTRMMAATERRTDVIAQSTEALKTLGIDKMAPEDIERLFGFGSKRQVKKPPAPASPSRKPPAQREARRTETPKSGESATPRPEQSAPPASAPVEPAPPSVAEPNIKPLSAAPDAAPKPPTTGSAAEAVREALRRAQQARADLDDLKAKSDQVQANPALAARLAGQISE